MRQFWLIFIGQGDCPWVPGAPSTSHHISHFNTSHSQAGRPFPPKNNKKKNNKKTITNKSTNRLRPACPGTRPPRCASALRHPRDFNSPAVVGSSHCHRGKPRWYPLCGDHPLSRLYFTKKKKNKQTPNGLSSHNGYHRSQKAVAYVLSCSINKKKKKKASMFNCF